MAQVDVGIHRLEQFGVKAQNNGSSFWVELIPKEDKHGTLGCVTFYVNSAEQVQRLASAFNACGAEWRSGGAEWLRPIAASVEVAR